jgi:predicted transposase YbfD/YdcC
LTQSHLLVYLSVRFQADLKDRIEVSTDVSKSFESHFGVLNDPRLNRTKLYPLTEIFFIVLSGSICGAESWRDFVLFGNAKIDFLRQYYAFKNGIPSKNTFASVFSALATEAFKYQFVEWVKSLQMLVNDVIAIDGKTLCNSLDKAVGTPAIHMVSAFATGARLILAQQKVVEKSNEITAIPKLLDLLDLKGQVVTIDAMGTQKSIAKQIIKQGGDYILALKRNQGTLNNDVRLFLETEIKKTGVHAITDRYQNVDKGHGRIETRQCFVSNQIDWLNSKDQWEGLKTIAMIEETQEINGVQTQFGVFILAVFLQLLSKLHQIYIPTGQSKISCIGHLMLCPMNISHVYAKIMLVKTW